MLERIALYISFYWSILVHKLQGIDITVDSFPSGPGIASPGPSNIYNIPDSFGCFALIGIFLVLSFVRHISDKMRHGK